MTLLDPPSSLANLIYIGYSGNPAAALRVTRRRSVDFKKQKAERNVFQCYVFGSKNAGKSTLLYSFLRRCCSWTKVHIFVYVSFSFIKILSFKFSSCAFFLFHATFDTFQLLLIPFTGLSLIDILQQWSSNMLQMLLN